MQDEFVGPNMRGCEAEAAFGVFDARDLFRVLCWREVRVLDRGQAIVHHAVVGLSGLVGEFFVEEIVESAGQGEVAVYVFFFNECLDCLDVCHLVGSDLGGSFQIVFFDVIRHAKVQFWP